MKSMKKQAQSLIEYGLILALVAVIAVVVLSRFGKTITDVGNTTSNQVSTVSNQAMNNYCGTQKTGSTFDTKTGTCTP